MAVLAVALVGTQPIVAADQPQASPSAMPGAAKPGVLKREYQAFKEAIRCARKEGFSKCSRAQKARVVIAGTALAAAIAATATLGYIGIKSALKRQTPTKRGADPIDKPSFEEEERKKKREYANRELSD